MKVLRYSDGAYMEDQDTWRLSGIYRDVYLMSTPKVHIRDFYVTTDLDDRYEDATLEGGHRGKNYTGKNARDYSVRIRLFDQNQQASCRRQGDSVPGCGEWEIQRLPSVISLEVLRILTSGRPNIPISIRLIMELTGCSNRNVLEILSSRVGFREVEVIDQAICVNGVPIKFNGVNSHMMHPETGHAMDVETMRKDLHLMKQFNINCVRTSHYPPNVEYLDLADELGIYIVDETGDEAHAYIQISHLPQWREPVP